MKKHFWLALFVASITWISCSHYEQLQQNPEESKFGEDESHNTSENCGSCHNVNGNEAVIEAGWWTLSGSVLNSQSRAPQKAVVELWEKPNKQGNLIKRLEVDDLGNFYTNQIINFKGGVYPSITTNNQTISMGTAFNGGSCNSCHGISTTKLTID
jgi:hypothetical protein